MPVIPVADFLSNGAFAGYRKVLAVTALGLEMKAVRAHVTHLASCHGKQNTIYECGHFNASGEDWLVVVVQSGAGNHPGQQAVSASVADFGGFELILFMGVAGSRKMDIPIGSVVAATYLYNPYSGKYDKGSFGSRPHSLRLDRRLKMVAEKVEREEEWQSRIVAPLRGNIPPDDVYPKPRPPAAFLGPIVSVEAVSGDPDSELEVLINAHYNDAQAVEMEGYGVAFAADHENIPALIVRGISDARTNKDPELDKIYQPVAGMHAAAFGFAVLDLWTELVPSGASALPVQTHNPVPTLTSPAPQALLGNQTKIVLNFAGSVAEFPAERVRQIEDILRRETGDETIRTIDFEEGSFRLIIEARAESLPILQGTKVEEALSRELSASLLGVLQESAYREVPADILALRRASLSLIDWPRTLPDGKEIDRPELGILIDTLSGAGRTTVILGDPGAGKSALLAAFAAQLALKDVPVLAIKADTLDPTIRTEADLMDFLGLSAPPSAMIAKLASLGPVVLLIDQLDALAGYVDINTGRLTTLLNMVRKLGDISNVHVVLSARTFEFEHDVRLKAVRAESITLELPPWSTVLNILEQHGIEAAGWPLDAQVVMRSPQALATFLKLANPSETQPFLTYHVMLDRLWQQRILEAPNGQVLSRLVTEIAEWMASREALWVARARFEDRHKETQALLAAGILIESPAPGGSVGFSHQTLFEHALARAFLREEIKLSKYVLDRQASIFIRPKLWAALTYLRQADLNAYSQEITAILGEPSLRRHLRRLCIEFLGQQKAPETFEVRLIETEFAAGNQEIIFQSIAGSPGWFNQLLHKYIEPAMEAEPDKLGYVTGALSRAWDFGSEDIVKAIRKKWLADARYDGATWNVLQACEVWNDAVMEVAQAVLARTVIADWALTHLVSILGVDQPKYASALVRASLDHALELATSESEKLSAAPAAETEEQEIERLMLRSPSEPFKKLLEGNAGWNGLEELGKAHPVEFLDAVWPWLEHVLENLKALSNYDPERLGFALPYEGDFRFEGETTLGVPAGPLLTAFQEAVETLAERDSQAFVTWAAQQDTKNYNAVQRLIAHGLTVAPEVYAEVALQFFKENTNRFSIGSIEDYSGTSKRLLTEVSPFWNDAQFAEFEQLLTTYNPKPRSSLDVEGRRRFRNAVRITKLGLLQALPQDRLSARSKAIVAEEERVYPEKKLGVTFGGGLIGSSIDAQGLGKATDDDILNAFRKIPDATGWNHPRDFYQGGNIQLSREFATFAKNSPDRAAAIIRKFEPSFGTRASAYALDSMAEAAQGDLIFSLVADLAAKGFDGEEFRSSVARAVEKLFKRKFAVPEHIRQRLEGWLESKPPKDEGSDDEEGTDQKQDLSTPSDEEDDSEVESQRRESVLWGMGGISVLPHGNYPILETLGHIYLVEENHQRFFALLKSHLGRSENAATWRALLRYIGYLRPENNDDFIAFLAALIEKYPAIIETREMAHFLGAVNWVVPDFVRLVLRKWRTSRRRWVRQGYGEMAAAMAFMRKDLKWVNDLLAEMVSGDDDDFKTGAAYAAINLWRESTDRDYLSANLQKLIPGANDRTWDAIFDIFRVTVEITPTRDWVDFLTVLASEMKPGRKCESSWIIEKLAALLPDEAVLVGYIATRLVVTWKNELGDIRTGTAATSPDFVDLALTLHRLGPETREVGTALFEDLLEVNAYSARQTLDEIDNRFLTIAHPQRPRLRSGGGRRRKRGVVERPNAT